MDARFTQDAEGRGILDLRGAAARRRPDLSGLPALSEEERQTAIRTWRGRMVNEHLSAQVWASLVPQLMRAAVPPELLPALPVAAADELRHAELCAGVVLALGGVPVAPLPEIEPVPEHADVGPLEAALRNVISVGCMSETMAVSIIRAEHAELDGGPLGDVLAAILADEVAHARFGWTLLGRLAPRLDDAARARLSAYLVDAFVHQVTYEVPKLPVVLGRRAAALGGCLPTGEADTASSDSAVASSDQPDCTGIDLADTGAYTECCDALSAWCQAAHGEGTDAAQACIYGPGLDGSTGCIPWGPPVPPRFRGASVVA